MPYPITQPIKPETPTYSLFHKVFSNEQCKEIIQLAQQIPAEAGLTASDPSKRVSDIRWIHYDPAVEVIFQTLSEVAYQANLMCWNFHLGSFQEPLQLTHYRAEQGGHYAWHEDRADKGIMSNRKLSGTVLLNDNFEGGNFELFDSPPLEKMSRGDIVLFPSYKVHRVNPVSKGERWSLVFWVTGPPFI